VTQSQNLLSNGGTNRPDTLGEARLSDPTVDRWFDPAAFAATRDNTGTYGNTGKNTLRGPGQWNLDLSLVKLTRLGRFEHELRVEAFNALNHPQFANPGSVIGNANAGVISSLLFGSPMRQVQLAMKLRW
jgi:hypothetical protein